MPRCEARICANESLLCSQISVDQRSEASDPTGKDESPRLDQYVLTSLPRQRTVPLAQLMRIPFSAVPFSHKDEWWWRLGGTDGMEKRRCAQVIHGRRELSRLASGNGQRLAAE